MSAEEITPELPSGNTVEIKPKIMFALTSTILTARATAAIFNACLAFERTSVELIEIW
jgi:hypothetical protein